MSFRELRAYSTSTLQHFNTSTHRYGSPIRRLSLHSKKLRLTWSANHSVRGRTSDHFPCVLGVLNFNIPTLQHTIGGRLTATGIFTAEPRRYGDLFWGPSR